MKRFTVIQGGKGAPRELSAHGPRFFKAFSVGDLTRADTVYHDVRFNWYCLDRELPIWRYEELIADYGRLEEKHRSLMEKEVDRLFTEEETKALRQYLTDKYGMGLEVEEVPLPVRERGYLFKEGESVIYDFIELSERAGYWLSFKVWGYYTLNRSLSSPAMENGVRFLRKALQLMDLPASLDEGYLEDIAKIIYAEEGLVVRNREEEG